MVRSRFASTIAMLGAATVAAGGLAAGQGFAAPVSEFTIGVLGFRGDAATLTRWTPTARWLSEAIPEYRFSIRSLDLAQLEVAVRSGAVDFVLTNPGNYVMLEARHGVSRIATLRNLRDGKALTRFGAVVVVRADRAEMTSLADLAGRSLAAVSRSAFGGFQMTWRELLERGIDPFSDLESVEFLGFPQDRLVLAVRDRRVDAGTVRTDVLERMAGEGRISLADFKVLDARTTPGFPFRHTSRLYPEWPFAKLRDTPDELAQRVAVALLTLSPDSLPALQGRYAGWTIPLDYGPVHELLKALRIEPYDTESAITLKRAVSEYRHLVGAVLVTLLLLGGFSAYVMRTNRRIRRSEAVLRDEVRERREIERVLARHRDQLEIRIRERTDALEKVNAELKSDIEARTAAERTLRRSESMLREMHEITVAHERLSEEKVRALLEAGCRHFGLEVGAFARRDGDDEYTVDICTGDADSLSAVLGSPRLSTPLRLPGVDGSREDVLSESGPHGSLLVAGIVAGQRQHGYLVFHSPKALAEPISAVDVDILRLMAQWIGGELELALVQAQVRQRQDELAHVARLGTLGEMATGLAHELNQPLTAILNFTRGCIRRMRSAGVADLAIIEAMTSVEQEAERAASVIRGLREFVRKGEPNRTAVNVNEAIRESLRVVGPEARRGGVGISLCLGEEVRQVSADRIQIEQVILNLARNALDALQTVEPSRRRLTISSTQCQGDEVEIEVRDTGAGLPGRTVETAFDPFFTTKPGGMGMGLSISRTIAEAHGGSLTAEPDAAAGAVFRFRLPVATEAELDDR